jgi:hypothetical protein
MTYSCSIEWHCDHAGTVRLHEGEHGRYGDPYVWACTITRQGDVATLKGAVGPCPIGGPRAIVRAAAACGITRRIIERRTASGVRVIQRENAACKS